jgi:hypothetical protein
MTSLNPRMLRHTRGNLQTLAQNAAHEFAARYALSIYAADAIYSFIPKNACSTMRYTLGIANGTIAGPEHFNWIHANNTTFQASLRDLAKAKYTFVILRDPYLRIASCYLDKIVDQTEVAWRYHSLTDYQTAPAVLTFRTFVKGLKSQLRGNEHWRPQLDFLVYERYDDFFSLEAFSDAVSALRNKIGLEVRDARGLTKHGADRFEPLASEEPFADKPAHAIATLKREGKMPRIAQMYDASLIAEIGEMYAADIAFYTQVTKRSCIFPVGPAAKSATTCPRPARRLRRPSPEG